MSEKKGLKCTVVQRNVTKGDISTITKNQKNTITINNREGEMNAFDVALKGSKVYLEAHGLLKK